MVRREYPKIYVHILKCSLSKSIFAYCILVKYILSYMSGVDGNQFNNVLYCTMMCLHGYFAFHCL